MVPIHYAGSNLRRRECDRLIPGQGWNVNSSRFRIDTGIATSTSGVVGELTM